MVVPRYAVTVQGSKQIEGAVNSSDIERTRMLFDPAVPAGLGLEGPGAGVGRKSQPTPALPEEREATGNDEVDLA